MDFIHLSSDICCCAGLLLSLLTRNISIRIMFYFVNPLLQEILDLHKHFQIQHTVLPECWIPIKNQLKMIQINIKIKKSIIYQSESLYTKIPMRSITIQWQQCWTVFSLVKIQNINKIYSIWLSISFKLTFLLIND